MKTIKDWQKMLAESANKKFQSNWSQLRRVQSIYEQLEDVKSAIEVEQGLLKSDDHAHQDPDHRVAALIADALILAETRGTDIEKELNKVLEWFEKK